MPRRRKSFLIILSIFFCFVSVAQCDYIDNYPPDSPWILNPDGLRVLKVDPDGSIRVRPQDQTTPPVIVSASKVISNSTLAVNANIGDQTVTVVSAAGMSVGEQIGIFSLLTNRYFYGEIVGIGVPGANDLLLDSPLDSSFLIGDKASSATIDMNVNGSITPQIFTLRGPDPGINVTMDVTRIILVMVTSTAPSYDKFGDIAGGITNGLLMRYTNVYTQNIFNVKTNADIGNMCYDYKTLDPSNPSGVYGIAARLTFSGPEKMGVVIRVNANENIEFYVQDDLSSLVSLRIVIEGSVVIP